MLGAGTPGASGDDGLGSSSGSGGAADIPGGTGAVAGAVGSTGAGWTDAVGRRGVYEPRNGETAGAEVIATPQLPLEQGTGKSSQVSQSVQPLTSAASATADKERLIRTISGILSWTWMAIDRRNPSSRNPSGPAFLERTRRPRLSKAEGHLPRSTSRSSTRSLATFQRKPSRTKRRPNITGPTGTVRLIRDTPDTTPVGYRPLPCPLRCARLDRYDLSRFANLGGLFRWREFSQNPCRERC